MRKIKLKNFIRRFFMDFYQFSNATALSYTYTLYHYTLTFCELKKETSDCQEHINKISSYLSLGCAFFQCILLVLQKIKNKVIQNIAYVFAELIGVLGLHGFLLKEFLFAYKNLNDNGAVVSWGGLSGFIALATTLSTLSNKKIREYIYQKLELENVIKKIADYFFEFLVAFIAFKSIIEAIAKIIKKDFTILNKSYLYLLYLPGIPWAIVASYASVKYGAERTVDLVTESAEMVTDDNSKQEKKENKKYNLKEVMHGSNDFFWSFIFSYFVVDGVLNEKNPHQLILWVFYGLLITVVIGKAYWTECRNRQLESETQEPLIHAADSIDETTNLEKKPKLEQIENQSGKYDPTFFSRSSNREIKKQEYEISTPKI